MDCHSQSAEGRCPTIVAPGGSRGGATLRLYLIFSGSLCEILPFWLIFVSCDFAYLAVQSFCLLLHGSSCAQSLVVKSLYFFAIFAYLAVQSFLFFTLT